MIKPSTRNGKIGKNNSLFYAFVVGGFLMWQSISLQYDKKQGWQFETRPVPLQIVVPCFCFMAFALGINIREELLIIASMVGRNSAAIAALAEQAQQQKALQESTQIIDTKSDEHQEL